MYVFVCVCVTMFFWSFLSRFLSLDIFGHMLICGGHTLILIFLNILVLNVWLQKGEKREKQRGKGTLVSSLPLEVTFQWRGEALPL